MVWNRKEFNKRLRIALAFAGLSKRKVSLKLGMCAESLYAWERRHLPRIDKVAEIAEIVGVEPAWLAFGSGEMVKEEVENLKGKMVK